jgi:tetratricopeptide (TPR) repeat protein
MKLSITIGLILFLICTGCDKADSSSERKQLNTTLDSLNYNVLSNPSVLSYKKRSQYYETNGALQLAIEDRESLLGIDSSLAYEWAKLSDLYFSNYQSARGIASLQKAIDIHPDNTDLLMDLAEKQYTIRRPDAAKRTIGKVLEIDKSNPDGLLLLGMIFRDNNEIENAIASIQSAVEFNADLVDGWIILGDLFERLDEPIALQYLDNAIRIDPNNIQALHSKAFYLQNHDQENLAIQIYDEILLLNPGYTDAYLNIGILYIEYDSIDLAVTNFEKLVQIDENNALGHYYLGLASSFTEDDSRTRKGFEKALSIDPTFVRAAQALKNIEQ